MQSARCVVKAQIFRPSKIKLALGTQPLNNYSQLPRIIRDAIYTENISSAWNRTRPSHFSIRQQSFPAQRYLAIALPSRHFPAGSTSSPSPLCRDTTSSKPPQSPTPCASNARRTFLQSLCSRRRIVAPHINPKLESATAKRISLPANASHSAQWLPLPRSSTARQRSQTGLRFRAQRKFLRSVKFPNLDTGSRLSSCANSEKEAPSEFLCSRRNNFCASSSS